MSTRDEELREQVNKHLRDENERLQKRVNYLEICLSRSGYDQTLLDAKRWRKLEKLAETASANAIYIRWVMDLAKENE